MKLHHYTATFIAAVLMASTFTVLAQDTQTETVTVTTLPAPVDKGPDDALGRGNPRGSIVGYLDAASKFNWEKAAEYLDLRNVPEDVGEIGGPELARQLNHVLSRSVWLDDYSVTEAASGVRGDGLPEYRDELLTIPTEDGPVPIWIQQVPRGDGEKIWKVSNRSVARIPELYDEFSYPAPVEAIRTGSLRTLHFWV